MYRFLQIVAIWGFSLFSSAALAYDLFVFDPGAFDANTEAMDIELGVSGFVIEDFEDTRIADGLRIMPIGEFWQVNISNRLYWDKEDGEDQGAVAFFSGSGLDTLVFEIPGGASSFGIGFSGVDIEHAVSVNGGKPIRFTEAPFVLDADERNGYVRIDAGPGDAPITSVSVVFDDPVLPGEAFRIDHVAFGPSAGLGTVINELLADPPTVNGEELSLVPGEGMTGPNENANRGRLGAFTNRLIAAQDLADTDLAGACEELASAAKKLAGENAWFVDPVAADLSFAIETTQNVLGCPLSASTSGG